MVESVIIDMQEIFRCAENVPFKTNATDFCVKRFLMPQHLSKELASGLPSGNMNVHDLVAHVFAVYENRSVWLVQYDHVFSAVGVEHSGRVWSALKSNVNSINFKTENKVAIPLVLRASQTSELRGTGTIGALIAEAVRAQASISGAGAETWFLEGAHRQAPAPAPSKTQGAPPPNQPPAAPSKVSKPSGVKATFENHKSGNAFGAVACIQPVSIVKATRKR